MRPLSIPPFSFYLDNKRLNIYDINGLKNCGMKRRDAEGLTVTNTLKTVLLLTSLTLLVIYLGEILGGRVGLVFAFGFALLMNGAAYWFSDRIVLALHRARPITETEAPELHAIVRRLAQRAGIPTPPIYLIPTRSPNAFATGRSPRHAAIAVTEGILDLLTPEELEGVLAHELSHVLNRDTLVSTVAAVLAGTIVFLARIAQWSLFWFGWGSRDDRRGMNPLGLLVMAILAPLAAMIIQLWISRTREYMADERGAELVGSPRGLIRALQKIDTAGRSIPFRPPAETVAHLYFARPRGNWLAEWLSTHPPIEKRIDRLAQRFGLTLDWV